MHGLKLWSFKANKWTTKDQNTWRWKLQTFTWKSNINLIVNGRKCTYDSSRKWVACCSHIFLLMSCLTTSDLFGLIRVSLVQEFTIESTTSFESKSFLFYWIAMAHCLHDPSLSYIFLPCPLFKILGFTLINWPTTFKFKLDFDITMPVRTFMAFMSSIVWKPFIPIHPSFIFPTISYVVSYSFDLTTTSSVASFKIGCFKSFSMVNFWYAWPFMLISLCNIGPIWFASLEVALSMSPMWGMFTFVDVYRHSTICSLLIALHLCCLSVTIIFGLPLLLTF